MTIPALPSALNGGDVVSNAWVDSVRDGLELHRDNRPLFRIRLVSETVGSGSWTAAAISNGASAFSATPWNVGGWTAEGASGTDAIVPETGVYQVNVEAEFDIATTTNTVFGLRATDGGSAINGIRNGTHESQANIATALILNASGLYNFTASDTLGVELYQDSGSSHTVNVVLSAVWLNSSTS